MGTDVAAIIWIHGLLEELEQMREKPVRLYCVNRVALQIAANPMYHERTKHIEVDYYFIRHHIAKRVVETEHVGTTNQLADIFTKALGGQQHYELLSKLGVKDIFESKRSSEDTTTATKKKLRWNTK